MNKTIKDLLTTIGIMAAAFSLSLATDQMSRTDMLIPMFFVLGVFLISVVTTGYLWGISASLISVLAVNYAFTFPYFEFNFSIPLNFFYQGSRRPHPCPEPELRRRGIHFHFGFGGLIPSWQRTVSRS